MFMALFSIVGVIGMLPELLWSTYSNSFVSICNPSFAEAAVYIYLFNFYKCFQRGSQGWYVLTNYAAYFMIYLYYTFKSLKVCYPDVWNKSSSLVKYDYLFSAKNRFIITSSGLFFHWIFALYSAYAVYLAKKAGEECQPTWVTLESVFIFHTAYILFLFYYVFLRKYYVWIVGKLSFGTEQPKVNHVKLEVKKQNKIEKDTHPSEIVERKLARMDQRLTELETTIRAVSNNCETMRAMVEALVRRPEAPAAVPTNQEIMIEDPEPSMQDSQNGSTSQLRQRILRVNFNVQ
uniref:Elongation of very long chain fatty acids protein n=1 Tax=Panagrolaimus sp. JU765 TaxID=591449 RepID=A0AC34RNJ0_9BILA